jgi:hypothetical protein
MSKQQSDTLKELREIRETLSIRYWLHPDILKKEMEEIRKEYKMQPLPDSSIAAEPKLPYDKKK